MVCNTQERTVFEKTCHYENKYECDQQNYGASGYVRDGYGSSSIAVQPSEPGQAPLAPESSQSASTEVKYGYDQPGADYQDGACEKRVEARCNTNPRQLSTQYCSERKDEVCERCTYRTPHPVEKEKC